MKFLICSLVLCLSHHANANIKNGFVSGEYIVKIKDGFTNLDSKALRKQLGVKKVRKLRGVDRWVFIKSNKSLAAIKKNNAVEMIEPNFIYRAELRPDERRYVDQWGLKNTAQKDNDGNTGERDIDVNIEKAWDITTGSNQVVVAVIDTE